MPSIDCKAQPQELPPLVKPPAVFTAFRWFFFTATVAIAIGQLALIDKHLTGLPWSYVQPMLPQLQLPPMFQGREVKISYCLLSPSMEGSVDAICNFALAAPAISLGLSLIWSYIQILRRNPFKHRKAKIADLIICCLGVIWWAGLGVFLCYFTDRANRAGVVQQSWRIGLCVLAWGQFLMFMGLAITSSLLVTPKSQRLFDKYTAKQRQKKEQRKAAKLQKQSDNALQEERDAAAAAAAARAAQHTPAAAGLASSEHHATIPQSHAPVVTPAAAADQRLPVSTSAVSAAQPASGDSSNPFLIEERGRVGPEIV